MSTQIENVSCQTTEDLRAHARLIVKVLGDVDKHTPVVCDHQGTIRTRYQELKQTAFCADAAEQARMEWVATYLMLVIEEARKGQSGQPPT